ncbi:hypothetical protein [Hymenobacter actinosclerus]|uniref:DUF3347 domain-containing protein n=1 Tax=Hymenobacter actinosclerus TaxID=82805 RepID=A0A1I0I5I9_9BACT|nr:hypothetical protein [Hymenobacter actinosclerus]SET91725.1 hypothetical protein SAMN04487998_3148 [Hymenobacter actinosclerus]
MEAFIIRLSLVLVALCLPAFRGTAQAVSPTDSLAESKIVASIGADICRQLVAENRKRPLDALSQEDTKQLFIRLMLVSLAGNPELMKRIAADPDQAQSSGEVMGRKVGLWLFRECPVSRPMIMRLGAQQLTKDQAVSNPAEEAVLTPMATQMCGDMEQRVKMKGQKTFTLAQNQALFQSALTPYMLDHMEEMKAVYGEDIFEDQEKLRALGIKLALKMSEKCPEIMVLLSDPKKAGR